jgi:uncharacterized damage-inducible protein DinB
MTHTAHRQVAHPRPALDLGASVRSAWQTNAQTTALFVAQLPAVLWDLAVPGSPRRTVRMLVGHLHNSRARWIRTLGQPHGITVPALVDQRRVDRRALLAALRRSGQGIGALLELGIASGGEIPATKAYVWRNLPLDVGHVLAYFVAHEGHHRGQVVMLARQLGHRLPAAVTAGLWQWSVRERRRAP